MWVRIGSLGLRQKLLGAFGIVLAITVLLSGLSYRAARNNDLASDWVIHSEHVITDLNQLLNALYGVRTSYSSYLLTGQDNWRSTLQSSRDQYATLLAHLREETADNTEQEERIALIDTLVDHWLTQTIDPVLAQRAGNPPVNPAADDTLSAIATARDEFNQFAGIITEGINAEQGLLGARNAKSQAQSLQLRRLLLFGTALAVLAGGTLAVLIARDIAGRMVLLRTQAQEIAGGTFGKRLNPRRRDEIGQTAAAFDQMADTLEATMAQLAASAREADAGRRQIAAILNHVADGIITFRPDGTITESNIAVERMFDMTEDEIRGAHVDDLLKADQEDDQATSVLSLLLPRGDETSGAMRLVQGCRDGKETFPLEVAVSQIEDGDGPEYIGVMRDITERVEAERKLQEQYEQAHRTRSLANAVLDVASEGMILISPDLRITAVNRRFADMFQISIPAVIGHSMKEFGPDLDKRIGEADRFREMLWASVRDSERRIEEAYTQAWPQKREMHMVSTPVRTREGYHVGRVFAFRDVTHEREVDRMKTEFVSMVSHELRTPLTSIKGYVDLLLEGEVGELSEEQHEFLEIVGANAERLVALINDILDISRIEAGKVTLNFAPVDIAALIERLAVSFRPQIEAKQQTLTLDLPAGLPSVRADHDRLTQIFTNLISNAHKYTPAGGHITVRATPQGRALAVSVADTGVGLSPEEQAQLFTRFYRAQNRATQEAGGTGLGLSITRSLVEMHGGTIAVESTPGEGTTFTVTLPLAAAPAQDGTPAAGAAPHRERADGRILIVEDEPDIARLLRRYLERAGYEVTTAPDATTAFQIARESPLDLITLDVILPDTDGFTLLEWLKSDPKTAAIPVIVLSMVADDGQGRTLGAVDYLAKPIREDALLQRIGRLLADTRPGTILVVDDEPDVRRLMAQQLSRAGYQTLEAANGEEAVHMVDEHAPELAAVFLDIRMPVMDGIRALHEIRQRHSAAALPVIMMTASPGMLDAAEGVAESLGITDLLEKPISGKELAHAIATHLQRGSEVPS